MLKHSERTPELKAIVFVKAVSSTHSHCDYTNKTSKLFFFHNSFVTEVVTNHKVDPQTAKIKLQVTPKGKTAAEGVIHSKVKN